MLILTALYVTGLENTCISKYSRCCALLKIPEYLICLIAYKRFVICRYSNDVEFANPGFDSRDGKEAFLYSKVFRRGLCA
jgi:hypothetical protein